MGQVSLSYQKLNVDFIRVLHTCGCLYCKRGLVMFLPLVCVVFKGLEADFLTVDFSKRLNIYLLMLTLVIILSRTYLPLILQIKIFPYFI